AGDEGEGEDEHAKRSGHEGGSFRGSIPCVRPVAARLANDGLEMGQHFLLELVEALAERVTEVAVPVLAALERLEVVEHARKAVALDQVVGHQERQLVGGQRAFLEVAHREAAGVAERLEVQPCGHQRRVIADPRGGQRAAVGQRVEAEARGTIYTHAVKGAVQCPPDASRRAGETTGHVRFRRGWYREDGERKKKRYSFYCRSAIGRTPRRSWGV